MQYEKTILKQSKRLSEKTRTRELHRKTATEYTVTKICVSFSNLFCGGIDKRQKICYTL
nr:MAG TPA: hypothetical protein [Caudoviricetes sp.]